MQLTTHPETLKWRIALRGENSCVLAKLRGAGGPQVMVTDALEDLCLTLQRTQRRHFDFPTELYEAIRTYRFTKENDPMGLSAFLQLHVQGVDLIAVIEYYGHDGVGQIEAPRNLDEIAFRWVRVCLAEEY